MKICIISAGVSNSRKMDFTKYISMLYPHSEFVEDYSVAEIFFVDYLKEEAIFDLRKYRKPIHMVGYKDDYRVFVEAERIINVCIITCGEPNRFSEFLEEVSKQYLGARLSIPSKAEMFFVDYLRKDMVEVLIKYEKPIYMIGYSAIQNNPKIFITKIGDNNE